MRDSPNIANEPSVDNVKTPQFKSRIVKNDKRNLVFPQPGVLNFFYVTKHGMIFNDDRGHIELYGSTLDILKVLDDFCIKKDLKSTARILSIRPIKRGDLEKRRQCLYDWGDEPSEQLLTTLANIPDITGCDDLHAQLLFNMQPQQYETSQSTIHIDDSEETFKKTGRGELHFWSIDDSKMLFHDDKGSLELYGSTPEDLDKIELLKRNWLKIQLLSCA